MAIELDNLDVSVRFVKDIEGLMKNKRISIMEAVVLWCEQHDTEIEYAASLIKKNKILKTKVRDQAESLNFMKKTAKLPV